MACQWHGCGSSHRCSTVANKQYCKYTLLALFHFLPLLSVFFFFSGDQTGECRAHGNLGSAFFSKGNYREALTNHRNQLVLAMKLKDREVRSNLVDFKAVTADRNGWSRAVVIAEDDESRLKKKIFLSLLSCSRFCCAQHSSALAV